MHIIIQIIIINISNKGKDKNIVSNDKNVPIDHQTPSSSSPPMTPSSSSSSLAGDALKDDGSDAISDAISNVISKCYI